METSVRRHQYASPRCAASRELGQISARSGQISAESRGAPPRTRSPSRRRWSRCRQRFGTPACAPTPQRPSCSAAAAPLGKGQGKVRERSGKGQGKVRERSGKGQGKVPLARQQPLLWEECPPSSVKLAEIISQTRRDHQQTSPRSSANLAEIISKPHRDHQQPRRDHQQTVISVYLDAAGRGGEARAAVLVHLWKKRPPS